MSLMKSELTDKSVYTLEFSVDKETFDKAFDSVIKNNILDLIEKYNVAMSIAEPKLFELYVCIYIHGNTYDAAAKEMAYSKDYVTKHHRRLMKYLINYFNNEEK